MRGGSLQQSVNQVGRSYTGGTESGSPVKGSKTGSQEVTAEGEEVDAKFVTKDTKEKLGSRNVKAGRRTRVERQVASGC